MFEKMLNNLNYKNKESNFSEIIKFKDKFKEDKKNLMKIVFV